MIIDVLASSSSGNCYRISDGTTSLLLECGIPIKQIRKSIGLSDISACLISHSHGDHSKSAKDILKAGIDVYTSNGTREYLGLEGHRVNVAKSLKQITIGTFQALPFETQHDAVEPLGFLIQSTVTGEKLLFATDTYYVKYTFHGLTHIMVECNYDHKILTQNLEIGLVSRSQWDRLIQSHFSLSNVKQFLKSNDLSKVQEIHLLHLSDHNSDADLFRREIAELTGKIVNIAHK